MPKKPDPRKTHFRPTLADGETPRCQAFSKNRPGHQCLKAAKPGFPVCELHGAGKGNRNGGRPIDPTAKYSQHNPDSPTFRESRNLGFDPAKIPAAIRQRFTRLVNNPQVYELHNELVILHARLEERLESIGDAIPLEAVRNAADSIRAAYTLLDQGFRESDVDLLQQGATGLRDSIRQLDQSLADETGQQAAWKEYFGLVGAKTALVEQGRRYRIEARSMIPVDEFAAYHRQIQAAVLANVKDAGERTNIAREFRRLGQQMFGHLEEQAPPSDPATAVERITN